MPAPPGRQERAASPRFKLPASNMPGLRLDRRRKRRCPWRRDMKVKLCAKCPYTPPDLADHYDPAAALHACAVCDREHGMSARHDEHDIHWSQTCSATLNGNSTAQQRVARFATESLASSATIPGEPLSVQRSAWITSGPAAMSTTDGCGDFAPPDDRRREIRAEFL